MKVEVNLSGLSREAAIEKAREMIDAAIEQAVEATETLIADHGGTDQEIAAERAITLAACIASRDVYLLQLRRQLDEPAAPAALQ